MGRVGPGVLGESITYDPDLTLQRSMLDDVRPFLTQSQDRYNWTGNVGGGDFFTFRAPNGSRDRLGRLRSHYAAQGPNLTDVTYAGETQNGSVSATIRTRLGRTDDLVRAYYDLEYVFHESVSYSRLAFFQIAADNYSDNDFQSIAYGNADEVVHDGPASPTGGGRLTHLRTTAAWRSPATRPGCCFATTRRRTVCARTSRASAS